MIDWSLEAAANHEAGVKEGGDRGTNLPNFSQSVSQCSMNDNRNTDYVLLHPTESPRVPIVRIDPPVAVYFLSFLEIIDIPAYD